MMKVHYCAKCDRISYSTVRIFICKKCDSECKRFKIECVDFMKLDMRVGTVLECTKVPKADKLLQFKIDDGLATRTILSGVAKHFNPEELVGKNLVLLANLAPRKIMGIESQGMLLSAVKVNEDGSETLRLLTADPMMPAGAEIG